MIKNPNWQGEPVGCLQSVVELNPRQPEIYPHQRSEGDFEPGVTACKPNALSTEHAAFLAYLIMIG